MKQVQIQRDDSQKIQWQVNVNETDNDLAKYSSHYRVNQIAKSRLYATIRAKRINKKSDDWKKFQKAINNPILIFLIIPLLALAVYGFFRWYDSMVRMSMAETPVIVVTDIPSPIANEVNSEDLEVEEITTQPTPPYYPIAVSSPLSSESIILPPPDPFKLAVNRAMSAASMAQSAQSKVEWEAVASQWEDATELMKILPASHPKYTLARTKVREYQSYYEYAMRVAKISAK